MKIENNNKTRTDTMRCYEASINNNLNNSTLQACTPMIYENSELHVKRLLRISECLSREADGMARAHKIDRMKFMNGLIILTAMAMAKAMAKTVSQKQWP